MNTFVIIVHVIACLILIVTILLQAGRGGGLAGLFGSGSSQTIFGTRAPKFLSRVTTAAAIIFLLTCITLTIFSSRKERSLMTGVRQTPVVEQVLPESATQGVLVEIEEEGVKETEAVERPLPDAATQD